MESKILYTVTLSKPLHNRTGATEHSRDGVVIEELPHHLHIESNPWVVGEYYLIHYNESGDELADTLHDGVYDAMEQAKFEFNVQKNEWNKQSG